MKWYKRFVSLLSLSVLLLLPIFSHLDSYASTTSSGNDTWTMPAETFLYYAFNGFAKQISAEYVVYDTLANLGYDGFRLWCENGDHWTVIENGNVVGHGGGGYSRDSDKIDYATNIDVPTDVKNLVLNYVQYIVTQNPLPYKECYINSYNFLSADLFPNYDMYVSAKEHIRTRDGYSILYPYRANATFQYIIATYYDRSNLNFVGTTTQGGFTNVHGYVGWSELTASNLISTADECVKINTNGSAQDISTLPSISSTNLYNTAMGSTANNGTYNKFYVFSNYEKNELVYVFSTLNALKNYNAGLPQPYYLTSSGQNTGTWTASQGGVINTGTMNNSGNYYSQVTTGVGSNWTPEQIIKLVDTVVGNGSGNGSGSGGNSNNPFSFLGKLGDLLGQLIGGVGDLLTGIVDGVVSIFLGPENENGVRSGGLFGTIRDLLSQISSIFDANIGQFISDVFGWLPTEIITLWTAGIFIAILFGILRIIRG